MDPNHKPKAIDLTRDAGPSPRVSSQPLTHFPVPTDRNASHEATRLFRPDRQFQRRPNPSTLQQGATSQPANQDPRVTQLQHCIVRSHTFIDGFQLSVQGGLAYIEQLEGYTRQLQQESLDMQKCLRDWDDYATRVKGMEGQFKSMKAHLQALEKDKADLESTAQHQEECIKNLELGNRKLKNEIEKLKSEPREKSLTLEASENGDHMKKRKLSTSPPESSK